MNWKNVILIYPLLFLFLILTGVLQAQEKYVLSPKSVFTVAGTSTLHDWEMVSNTGAGSASVTIDRGRITGITHATITMPAESLKSGRTAMDKNTYKALNTDQYQNITFVLAEVRDLESIGNETRMTVLGDLTVAGATRRVKMDVTGKLVGEQLQFEGSTDVLLTGFDIEPPTAVLGTIRTGDAVTLSFNTIFHADNKRR